LRKDVERSSPEIEPLACFNVSYEVSESRFSGLPETSMTRNFLPFALAGALALSLAPSVYAVEAKPKKEPSAAQMASRERMSKCSAEWKETKAAGKAEAGMKWPKFWSQCNARMKANKT
jgi:hypothetical protein